MRKYFEKGKRWLRTHRRSRAQAALQNICAVLLFTVLSVLLLQGYAADHSVEAAVKQWCEENMFGKAEILAVLEYEEDKHQQKEVVIGKEMENGDRYEAKLSLYKENPLKWVRTGFAHNNAPVDYDIEGSLIEDWGNEIYRFPGEAVGGIFPELIEAEWVEVAYVPTHVMEGLEPGPDSHMSLQVGLQFTETEAAKRGDWEQAQMTYWVNLDSMEVEQTNFHGVQRGGKEAQLWLSEERMIFMAEKLMAAIPAAEK
ncbi:MAG: hypothetical protein IJ443_06395 [Firmicutes bacterium]|nr:hypothetical protein [Bacillota bacterium]